MEVEMGFRAVSGIPHQSQNLTPPRGVARVSALLSNVSHADDAFPFTSLAGAHAGAIVAQSPWVQARRQSGGRPQPTCARYCAEIEERRRERQYGRRSQHAVICERKLLL